MSDLDVHLDAIRAGDTTAFGTWAASAEARLRLSLSSFARTVDTEAVVQETLLRVWQVAPRIEPDGRPNSLLRFAVRCARNVAISELRKHGRPLPDLASESKEVRPIEPDPALRRVIAQCRDKLPRRPGQALDQRLAQGGLLPDRELAASLNMRLNTFLQNVGRARKLLAACLERHGIHVEMMTP
jgi:RNA polymerase sigma-70 factor (ECF subfamily)